MKIQDAIQCLDQLCRNNRANAVPAVCLTGQAAETDEAGRLAIAVLHACELAGAKTTEEALAIIRVYPMLTERCKSLEHQLESAHQRISDLTMEKRMLTLMFDAAQSMIRMPGVTEAIVSSYAKDPVESVSAAKAAFGKLIEAQEYFKEALAKEAAGRST